VLLAGLVKAAVAFHDGAVVFAGVVGGTDELASSVAEVVVFCA